MAKTKTTKEKPMPLACGPVPEGHKRVVRIRADKEGFRRAGLKHSKTPVDHPADSISDDQMEALVNEPKLKVEVVDVPVAAAPKEGGAPE